MHSVRFKKIELKKGTKDKDKERERERERKTERERGREKGSEHLQQTKDQACKIEFLNAGPLQVVDIINAFPLYGIQTTSESRTMK